MSQSNKNRVHVIILGEKHIIKGDASEEYMKEIAGCVDVKMEEICTNSNGRLGFSKVAVLTALNLADELFRTRAKLHELEELLELKTSND